MKKIISTQQLTDGTHYTPELSGAIHERVDNKLLYCYKFYYGEDIQVVPTLSYQLTDGVVTALELAYIIDNPTPLRLENFRECCENFYELSGFTVEGEGDTSRVLFRATDLFDQASLIHALLYQTVSLHRILRVVDDSLTEQDDPLDDDDIPDEDDEEEDIPVEEEDDLDFDMPTFDDHGVGYSKDGKTLTGCLLAFNDPRYEVPDGVEAIDDFAFLPCRHYVELSIPRSVRKIGDFIFGNGGVILVRDE